MMEKRRRGGGSLGEVEAKVDSDRGRSYQSVGSK